MGYVVSTPPAAEPLSPTEAKAHLRVDHSDEDTLIASIIKAARVTIENYLDKKLVTQTITEYFDEFPASGVFELSFWPVQSISSITYTDTDGDTQTWDSANYQSDLNGPYNMGPARITTAYSASYPSTRDDLAAIAVQYVAGYGDAEDVPDVIKAAMRLLIADMYENRTDSPRGAVMAWQRLLNAAQMKRIV